MHDDSINWDAPEYHHHEKTADWYWSLGIIAIAVVVLCVLFGNILFAGFILLAALTAALYAGRTPELVSIELNRKGVRVGEKMYPYKTLDSFWVEEEEHPQTLLLKSKMLLMPLIVIEINHVHTDDIRYFLRMFLKEEEHHESAFHRLFEYFGF